MKKYGNLLRRAWHLIAGNWKTWILFLIFYNVVGELIYNVVTYGLYAASLKLSGVSYLALNTLGAYLLCPVTWLYIIVSLLLSMFLIMLEISALYQLFDASRRGETISLSRTLYLGISEAWKSMRWKNIKLFLYLLVMLPILGASLASNMSYSITIPGFIMDPIRKMKLLYVLFCVAMAALALCTCRMQYSIAAFELDGCTFKEAEQKSRRLLKGRFLYSVLSVFATYLLMIIVFAAVGALIGALTAGVSETSVEKAIYIGAMFGLVGVSILGPTVLTVQIPSLYYEISEEKGETLPVAASADESKGSGKAWKPATAAVFLICLALTVAFNAQDTSLNMTKLSVPEIAAHRGDSGNAPENTMPAFEQAIKDGCCDWIELDVHETKDGVIVVSHDDTLLNIDGTDRCIHDMTYDELSQVDFGSRFSEAYAGTKVATLDEVLDYCKGKIKLQIEIKPPVYTDTVVPSVVNQIREHDMVDDCVVLSMDADILKSVKQIDPEITTMYCMAISAGEVTDIDFAEYISIEEQNVTPNLINSMHAQGRKVFVWTINSADSVQNLVDCGADVILTDFPLDINEALKEADYSGGIARTLRLYLSQY